jgi:hypothetical protein
MQQCRPRRFLGLRLVYIRGPPTKRRGTHSNTAELEEPHDHRGQGILVTGANRGIGQTLVAEALSRGAKRVYAGTRHRLAHPDGRVIPVTLDVTDAAQIQAAAEQVESLALPRAFSVGRARC